MDVDLCTKANKISLNDLEIQYEKTFVAKIDLKKEIEEFMSNIT